MMTKKLYGEFASAIKSRRESYVQVTKKDVSETQKVAASVASIALHQLARDLVPIFKKDNPNFNPDLFYKACGF